jgi:hypothetical protein
MPTDWVTRYLVAYRDKFGVKRICRVLGVRVGKFLTSRRYRAIKISPLPHRAIRDQALGAELRLLLGENYGVYGVSKMYYLTRHQGRLFGREPIARVMKPAQ